MYIEREREKEIHGSAVEGGRGATPRAPAGRLLRPVRLLRVWISEGLTQADS